MLLRTFSRALTIRVTRSRHRNAHRRHRLYCSIANTWQSLTVVLAARGLRQDLPWKLDTSTKVVLIFWIHMKPRCVAVHCRSNTESHILINISSEILRGSSSLGSLRRRAIFAFCSSSGKAWITRSPRQGMRTTHVFQPLLILVWHSLGVGLRAMKWKIKRERSMRYRL